jgi:RNA-directed DNA polymerase
MNSRERHEARYKRRVIKRQNKRDKNLDDFDKIFTFDNLYNSYKKCRLGVSWKGSTQKYKSNAIFNVMRTYNELHNDKYKTGNFYEFNLVERGKIRHIRSVHISERVVQRCLCDNSLIRTMGRTFIKDNGACQKGKGVHFSRRRLRQHLYNYYKRNKTNKGYVLLFDFSKYFDNIDHDTLKEILRKEYKDERILKILFKLIDDFGDKGLGLGSQISQTCALAYPNRLDHYIKEVLRIKEYGRYMDDGYLISESKEKLKTCLEVIKAICDKYHIKLNTKKTYIIKLENSFTFLKIRFILTTTGKVIQVATRDSTTRMRRKLKKLKNRCLADLMSANEVKCSVISWLGCMKWCSSYRQRQEIIKLYNKLFKEFKI